jgi:prephenate dehydrogenase
MDLLVVGAGEMGRWFADAVGAEDVAFADAERTAAERAATATGGRAVDLEGDERAAVVCVAVPIPAVEATLAAHADRAREAVVDVTGVMGPAVAAMREHAPDRGRLSLHPLFAPRRAPGRIAAVEDADAPAVTALREALVDRGNDLFDTTPAEHDRAMATVQARAHTAVLAYGLAREAVPEAFHTPISRTLTDLVDQVTEGTPRVYADIQNAFDGAGDVAAAAGRLSEADDETFAALYREAGGARDRNRNADDGDASADRRGEREDAGGEP